MTIPLPRSVVGRLRLHLAVAALTCLAAAAATISVASAMVDGFDTAARDALGHDGYSLQQSLRLAGIDMIVTDWARTGNPAKLPAASGLADEILAAKVSTDARTERALSPSLHAVAAALQSLMAEQAQPTQLRQGRRDQLTQATARATGRARSDLQSSFVATSARIQTDLDQASALRRRQQVIAGGAATALIIVFLLLASFVNRQILAPVIALRVRMDAFDGRHHDSPPHPTQRRDLVELAALGDAFDTMARQVIDGRSALHHQAHTDELTGLPNRRAFFAHLTELRSKGGGYTVAYIDLDGFKDISDRHGHSIGDHVLESVAARLTQHSRPDDFAARLGGDEFALLLPGADADTAARAVARIMTAVLHPLDSDAGVLDVKASVGTGHHRSGRTPPNDIDQAVRTADAAMYEAKKRGRGRVSAPAGSNERHAHVRKPGRALPT